MLQAFRRSSLLKIDPRRKVFSCKLCKIFKETISTEQLWKTVSCVYPWILRSFLEQFYHRTLMGDCLLHLQVLGFQPAYTVTISQLFVQKQQITIGRCSFNQNPWKLSMKKLIRSEVVRGQSARPFTHTFTHTFFKYFAFIFSEHIMVTFSKEVLKLCKHSFFQEM